MPPAPSAVVPLRRAGLCARRDVVGPRSRLWESRLTALAYRAAAWATRRLPRPWAVAVGRGGGELCWFVQGHRRRVLSRNWRLHAAAPRRTALSSRRAFRRFGEELVETLRLAHATPLEVLRRVEFVDLPWVEASAGPGIVLLSLHSGNWEWAGAALALRGHRVRALARPHRGPVERFFAALRGRFGVETRARALDLDRGAGWVALFLDRPGALARTAPHRAARRAVALAARRGWAVAPCWVETLPRAAYRVTFGPVARPGARAAERDACARAALDFLGRRLARQPDQWFAFEPLGGVPLGRLA